jgi:hypothetical protein
VKGTSANLTPGIQQTCLNGGLTGTCTLSGTHAGDAIVAYVSTWNTAGLATNLSSSAGDSFVKLYEAAGLGDYAIYYACNIPGGNDTLTAGSAAEWVVVEVNNVAPACFDTSVVNGLVSPTVDSVTATSTDIILTAIQSQHGGFASGTKPSGYTAIGNDSALASQRNHADWQRHQLHSWGWY